MSKADNKKRPIEERIAALMGRTAFCDIRDGFGGGGGKPALTDQDVAAALGIVATVKGRVACMVLETHYGSTVLHLESLLRAWDEREFVKGQSRERTALTRFAGELAIRELASVRYGTPVLAHYAYLICSRRESLQARMADCTRWLHDHRDQALGCLRSVLREARGLPPEMKRSAA